MKNTDLVVKTNRLVRSIQRLSIQEIRLIQLAIVEGRNKDAFYEKDGSIRSIRVDARRYAEIFNISRDNAYKQLIAAEARLFGRYFFILDKEYKGLERKVSWIQDVLYLRDKSSIEITFSQQVVKEIARIDGLEDFFTKYALQQTSKLSSQYSVRLYEIASSWKNHSHWTDVFPLEQFREQLGLGVNEYSRMSDFKRRVLDFAVDEINTKTDLHVKYKQNKSGRKITGFHLRVKANKGEQAASTRDSNTADMLAPFSMTDNQRTSFARKLSELPELGNFAPVGMTAKDYTQKIANDLLDPEKQDFYKPHLAKVGYKPTVKTKR